MEKLQVHYLARGAITMHLIRLYKQNHTLCEGFKGLTWQNQCDTYNMAE